LEKSKKSRESTSNKGKVKSRRTSRLRSLEKVGTSTTQNEKLLLYLNEALAMENATIERLESRARSTRFQDLRTRIEQHSVETREQQKRLIELIRRLGGNPTQDLSQLAMSVSPKSILDQLHKKLSAAEAELKDIKMDMDMEYSESTQYEVLLQLAEKAKNEDAIRILSQNLDEERGIIIWMRTYVPSLISQLWQNIPAQVSVVGE
jgi:ferritin-like metal-binding protein YciE